MVCPSSTATFAARPCASFSMITHVCAFVSVLCVKDITFDLTPLFIKPIMDPEKSGPDVRL